MRILQDCRGTASASSAAAAVTREPRKSSAWLPGQHPRAAGPEDVISGGCPCAQGMKFPQWLHRDCGIGHIVVTPATVFNDCRTIIPTVLHSVKFQILGRGRAHPVDLASIMRGVIDEFDLRTIRVAGTAEACKRASASPVQPDPWGSADKHKVMWLVPATLVQEAIKGKGKGDKGSKGNAGSQGDKGSMGHEGSKGGKAHIGAVVAPSAHHNLLRLPSLCGSLARCTSP